MGFGIGQPITIQSDDQWNGTQGIVEHVFRDGSLSVRVESQEERIRVEPHETEEWDSLPLVMRRKRTDNLPKLCDCGHYSYEVMSASAGTACPACYDGMSN